MSSKYVAKNTNKALLFKKENPELYKEIMEKYHPVFDKIIAIEMYQRNESPPICEICGDRLQVSKKLPKRCSKHSNIKNIENLFTYEYFSEKYPGNYIQWNGLKSLSDYITIICDQHGEYTQIIKSRISGHGCQKCYFDNKVGKYRINEKLYLEEFFEKHGNTYDYSLVQFSGSAGKIDIICKKHGIFKQASIVHKSGHGCPKCANENTSMRQSTEEHILKLREQISFYIKNNKNKKKDTSIELKCKYFLDNNNIMFEHQYILYDELYGKWAYDFYIKSKNLLIETDGEYFHTKKETFNRDKIKNILAEKHGYLLLRLSDKNLNLSLILSDEEQIRDHTREVMENRQKNVKE